MMVKIRCEKCGFSKKSDDTKAGKTVRCPKCGERIVVGGGDGARPKTRPVTRAANEKSSRPATRAAGKPATRASSRPATRARMSEEEPEDLPRQRRPRRGNDHALGIFLASVVGLAAMLWVFNHFRTMRADEERLVEEQYQTDLTMSENLRAAEQATREEAVAKKREEEEALRRAEEAERVEKVQRLSADIEEKYKVYAKYQRDANAYKGVDQDLYVKSLATARHEFEAIEVMVEEMGNLGGKANDLLRDLEARYLRE